MTDEQRPDFRVDPREERNFAPHPADPRDYMPPPIRLASLPQLTVEELDELHMALGVRRSQLSEAYEHAVSPAAADRIERQAQVNFSIDTAVQEARASLHANHEGDDGES